ncbi:MAG: SoxR reducing system RseC family protein [Zoogloeaceae bacterium]|jgi:sigma-E factor negative regulatory protein RseC|nr:SoxR reducing system RseC family protein [Zoogloeaceae bacterium]
MLSGDEAVIEMLSGCGRCHEEGGCGGVELPRLFAAARRHTVANPEGAAAGEQVWVHMPDAALMRQATILAYGLPLAGLLAGAVLGQQLGGEGAAFVGAALGLALAFCALYVRGVRKAGKSANTPYITRTV